MLPFVAHATRGIVREQRTRRKTMCVLLALALLMVLAGATFLQSPLQPREHVGRFLVFWLACAWLTATALLLALFDLLILRSDGRAARWKLQAEIAARASRSDEP